MTQVREHEPEYALLADRESHARNRYGRPIELAPQGDRLREQGLRVNDAQGPGTNPNRYKQHGFYFNADNCIACHACEAACSEKNDNPAHIAFRSVGFVEGGSYPDYQRINISMACNHCDDPVCLKGCPTRAYTKYAEYGAVLQDPDICFGCGYCTWVCPYNAPQLDPIEGQVSKCNMCVDRLEVGLKPSCVAACLGKALDFGIIESIPEGCTQAKTEIPGFPRPDITHPNIRFQQVRTPQREMRRVDHAALKYRRDDATGTFRPTVDPKHGWNREWNLGRLLGSHENAHIAFTLSTQTVMGAFLLLVLGTWAGLVPVAVDSAPYLSTLGLMIALVGLGLFKLNMHLGKPHRFYRGFYNLRLSPVSREIAGVSLFFVGLAGYGLFALFDGGWAATLRVLSAVIGFCGAVVGGYYMVRLYRIPARPFWDHWHTDASFAGTALSLGALLVALVMAGFEVLTPALGRVLAGMTALGLTLQGTGLIFHARHMRARGDEGAASYYEQTTRYGYPYGLGNLLLVSGVVGALGLAAWGSTSLAAFALLAVIVLAGAILSRALFYVVVIPTTMPGAFFWRNQGFVEHARRIGLAQMPQLGVAYERRHPFRWGALVQTLRTGSTKEALAQLRRIVTG